MLPPPSSPTPRALPTASLADTLGVLAAVGAPNLARGPILRRPWAVTLIARLGLDRRALRRMQRLRDTYGAGPVMLRLPGRRQAVLLAPEHVRRVLDGTPEPFAAASSEKRAALAHFQPEGVLISRGPAREARRRVNDRALESTCPRHAFAAHFGAVVREEAARMLAEGGGTLAWPRFRPAWYRAVRGVVLGRAARDDAAVTDALERLRGRANWAFLAPRRRALRARFLARVADYVDRAEPGSLAAAVAAAPAGPEGAPAGQVPQWLFAFDAAGIAVFRALALLDAHPAYAERALAEADGAADDAPVLPLLRAAVLDALRLWPTTPMVLRQTTADTAWEAGHMPAGTGILILSGFFHRDGTRLPYADRFAPELWLDAPAGEPAASRTLEAGGAGGWPLIPFSAGPAVCPGRQVALLVATTMLAALLRGRAVRVLAPARLDADRPLPATLDHTALRVALDARPAA